MHPAAHALALAILDGPWEPDALEARLADALGVRRPWLRAVARRVLATFPVAPHPDHRDAVAAVIADVEGFRAACARGELVARRWALPAAPMLPCRHPWPVPALPTSGDLAAWLAIDPATLEGYADVRGLQRFARDERARHHRVRWVPKASGGWRPLEAPKARLKALQRRVLDGVVAHLPPHPAAHGFVCGRSALTHASAHAGRAAVLRVDLADFFASVHGTLVRAIFREAGYPDEVAARLAGLCTTRTPRAAWDERPEPRAPDALWKRLREPHLAQGAPTSPALANLALFRLDRRLDGLAHAFGATYTRYADDLTFSSDGPVDGLARAVAEIVGEAGFAVRAGKTRVMRRSRRQRVAGLVVNERPAVARDEYDRLRATLHRCATRGPAAADVAHAGDLRAHLRGRVAHVAASHPTRAEKLRALFERIAW